MSCYVELKQEPRGRRRRPQTLRTVRRPYKAITKMSMYYHIKGTGSYYNLQILLSK